MKINGKMKNITLKSRIKDLEKEVEREREEKRKMDKEIVDKRSKIEELIFEVYLKGERCKRLNNLYRYNKNLYDTENSYQEL